MTRVSPFGTYFGKAPRALWPRLLICENGRNRWETDMAEYLAGIGYRILTSTRTNLVLDLAQNLKEDDPGIA